MISLCYTETNWLYPEKSVNEYLIGEKSQLNTF